MLLSEPQGGPGDECIGNHCNGIHTYPMECIRNGMQWYPMHWIPLHTIANAFHRIGMDTIAMVTYAFITGAALRFTQQHRVLPPSTGEGSPSPGTVSRPAVVRQTTV